MSYNEHTKQKQQTKVPSKEYRDNWDNIFGLAHAKKEGCAVHPDDMECDLTPEQYDKQLEAYKNDLCK